MPARPGDRDAPRGVTCSRIEDAIAWAQGQLAPGEEKDFAAHLAECAACRAEAAEAEKVLALLRSRGEPPPSVDLVPRVLAGLDAESARSAAAWRRRPAAWRLAAAAALAIAGIALAIQAWMSPGKLPARGGEEELASERAVEWLERAQEPSGGFYAARWGGLGDYDVGLTGLAALAFLSRPGPRNQHAAMALDFLLSAQSADGRIGPAFAGAVYNHGIATVAILEAFGTSPEERLRAPIDRAVSYIERTRCREGGWGYLGDDAAGANTAATCWPLQALLLARSLGWKGLDGAIEGGFQHLARVTDDRGRVGYQRAGEFQSGTDALSSMGALCLLLDREARSVPPALRGRILDGVARTAARSPAGNDLYRDFFLHSALEAFPAGRHGPWLGEARRVLAAAQVAEGPHRGSWEPSDSWGPAGGRVYSTAIGALILDAEGRGRQLEGWTGVRG